MIRGWICYRKVDVGLCCKGLEIDHVVGNDIVAMDVEMLEGAMARATVGYFESGGGVRFP